MNVFGNMMRKNNSNIFVYGYQPIYFHTGTIYDLESGRLSYGIDGRLLVGGGFGNFLTAVQGPGNMFKTTLILSNLIKTLEIYPYSNAIIIDTEGSIISDLTRVARFSNSKDKEILDRIHPMNGKAFTMAEIYKYIKDLLEEREKLSEKDLFVETPFINLETKKLIKTRIPLFILFDSFSELIVTEAQELISKGFDNEKFNTVHMVAGNKKSSFLQQLSILAERYGVSIILSSQMGKEINMGVVPQQKQLVEMRQGERAKGVSAKYEFLPHIAYQMWSSRVFLDSSKTESQYPYDEYTLPKELHETSIKFVRQKINMSGSEITNFIISQRDGVQPGLTNFEYLKKHEYYGLLPNGKSTYHTCELTPDKKFSRRTVRKLIDDEYEVKRGIDICTQLHYVQTNWRDLIKNKYPNLITPNELYNKFMNKSSSIKIQDILNSRSYWTYNKEDKRPWMDIFTIMDLVNKK